MAAGRTNLGNRVFKRLIVVGLVIFVVIQFVGPARSNPATNPARAVTKHVTVPSDVKTILDRACWNCHSNQTRWPWYSYVAPVSWNVIAHVNDGRGSMNLTAWPEGPEEAAEILDAVCDEVKKGHMPLPQYVWMHPEARLSDADRARLCAWTEDAAESLY
jgi:hypothetical protein